MNERNPLAQLQKEYRRAWHHFLNEVESLQSAMNAQNPEQQAINAQKSLVEMASAEYRNARNALAKHLLETGVHSSLDLEPADVQAA